MLTIDLFDSLARITVSDCQLAPARILWNHLFDARIYNVRHKLVVEALALLLDNVVFYIFRFWRLTPLKLALV